MQLETQYYSQYYLCGLQGLDGLDPSEPFGCLCGLEGAECTPPPPPPAPPPPGDKSLLALARTGVEGGWGERGDTGG